MKLRYLPLIVVLLMSGTLLITFGMAVRYKHVMYLVPYISDSGALPPESCIFGQILNVIAILRYIDWQYSSIHEQISPYHSTYVYLGIYTVLVALTMYVKYRQVKEIFSRHDIRSSYKVNIISFYVGMLAATGISLVANFPETSVLTVHVTGAFMAFGLGAVYQCLQTFLYYKVSHVMENKYRNIIRLMLSIVSIVTFFICAVFALIAFGMYDGDSIQNWKKEDNGFRFHIISTVSEWVCASCTLTFICMFQTEFEDIDMKEPQICIEDNFVRRVDNRDMELKIYDRY